MILRGSMAKKTKVLTFVQLRVHPSLLLCMTDKKQRRQRRKKSTGEFGAWESEAKRRDLKADSAGWIF
jgi:hypothetical protein